MNTLKDLIKNEPVHERRLEMKSYHIDDDRLLVEGRLRDERFIDVYTWDGKKREPGLVHHMCIRLLIGGTPLTILDAEVEMDVHPHELCPETADCVKKVIGVQIVPGYSDKVRRLTGGTKGCTHLSHLINVMGPAAVHGFWTQASREPRPVPKSLDEFKGIEYLIDSCQLWRKDGPLLEMIGEALKTK